MRSLHAHRCRVAFTIAQLAVLIAIVMVLTILIWPTICIDRSPSRKQEALNVSRSIAHSLENFRIDYGHYPQLGKSRFPGEKFVMFGPQEVGCSQGNAGLFDTLRAIPEGSNVGHALNPKQVKYIEFTRATYPKNPRGGFTDGEEYAPEGRGRLMDPWGLEYCVVIETDGDQRLDLSSIFSDLAGKPVPFGVAAFSLGKDNVVGGKRYAGKFQKPNSTDKPDDIVSWQP